MSKRHCDWTMMRKVDTACRQVFTRGNWYCNPRFSSSSTFNRNVARQRVSLSVTATFGRGQRQWKSTLLSPRDNNLNNNVNHDNAQYIFAHIASVQEEARNSAYVDFVEQGNNDHNDESDGDSYDVFYEALEEHQHDFSDSTSQTTSTTALTHTHTVATLCSESRVMNLSEAAEYVDHFDKILLLVSHAETEVKNDSMRLSGRGAGQALDLSRLTATYCNKQTGLVPELVVLSNHQPVIQTTMKAFPYYTPLEIEAVPWITHPFMQCERQECEEDDDVLYICDGDDDSSDNDGDNNKKDHHVSQSHQVTVLNNGTHFPTTSSSTKEQLDRSEDFLKWIQGRKEKVIVISSQSQWLQAFNCRLASSTFSTATASSRTNNTFGFGEMRAVGVNFMRL